MTTPEQWRDELRNLRVSDILFMDNLSQLQIVAIERFIESLLSQANKEAVEVKMSELYKEIKERREERLSDPWAFGFNIDRTNGSAEDLKWVLSLLHPHSKDEKLLDNK